MHLTQITCLLLFLLTTHQARADDDSSTETNEIIPREAIQKLDFSVRQALLRAIDKLEKEANDEVIADEVNNDDPETEEENEEVTTIQPTTITIQSTTALPLTTQQTKDEILEESTSSSDIFPSVQFFTATYDENHAQEQPLAAFIDKSKTTFKKFNKNFGSPVVVATDVKEETPDNHQAARSVANANNNNNNVQSNEISLNGLDEIKFEIRNTKLSHKPQTTTTTTEVYTTTTTTTPRPRTTKKRKPTTTTTTTTTTPRPTHNEDGENIEIVEKDDIRIQAAPLVSAFTVDLDEQGAAKKVVPIIDRPAATVATAITSTQRTSSIFRPPLFGPTITKLNVLQADAQRSAALSSSNNLSPTAVPTQATFGSSTSANIFSNIVPTSGHYITKQPLSNINQQQQHQQQQNQQQQQQQGGNVNNYLLEKQRELEQQIYQLKLQAQQQQELIIRQIKLLEEQSKLRNTQATAQATNTILQTQTQLSQQQQQSQRPQQLPLVQQEPGFTIRPSVEFIPSTQTKSVPIYQAFSLEQQLPLKESNGKYIKNNGFSNSGLQNQQQQQQPQQQQQELPNPIQQVFQNLRNLHQTNSQAAASISNIQIQPSNQLNIVPTFSSATSSQSSAILQQTPAELSHVQALPQRNYQQFQQNPLVPQYVTNALLERQQQQQQQQQQQNQQQQHQARFFRQEGETGNFGVNQVQIQPSNNIFSSYNQDQQQQQQQQQSNTFDNQNFDNQNFDNQNFYRQHLIPEFSNQLQQNAQQYYQQQQQQQQQTSQTGNYFKHQQQQRFHNNRLNSLTNNLEEFNIINKVLALNHGINNFAQQQSSAPTLSTQSQSARFSSNIF